MTPATASRIRQLARAGRTRGEIAAATGQPAGAISRALRAAGMSTRQRRLPHAAALLALVADGQSQAAIALEHGVSPAAVSAALQRALRASQTSTCG
jgi:hypothetical protein